MQDTALTWKGRYERMKAHYRWKDDRVAELTGIGKRSIQASVTATSREFPAYLKGMIQVYEIENGHLSEVIHLWTFTQQPRVVMAESLYTHARLGCKNLTLGRASCRRKTYLHCNLIAVGFYTFVSH